MLCLGPNLREGRWGKGREREGKGKVRRCGGAEALTRLITLDSLRLTHKEKSTSAIKKNREECVGETNKVW